MFLPYYFSTWRQLWPFGLLHSLSRLSNQLRWAITAHRWFVSRPGSQVPGPLSLALNGFRRWKRSFDQSRSASRPLQSPTWRHLYLLWSERAWYSSLGHSSGVSPLLLWWAWDRSKFWRRGFLPKLSPRLWRRVLATSFPWALANAFCSYSNRILACIFFLGRLYFVQASQ